MSPYVIAAGLADVIAALDPRSRSSLRWVAYSRMVSIYMYNRMGPLEDFGSFVRSWHKMLQPYRRAEHSTEEWDV